MTRVVRHKHSRRFAHIISPDVVYEGELVDNPQNADIFNEDIDGKNDKEILQHVAYAKWDNGVENADLSQWEVVPVKIKVEIL